MEPRKFRLAIATYSYGGNGGLATTHPCVMQWLLKTVPAIKADPRIASVVMKDFVDTPITMTRNASVLWAREKKADLLLMIDSDMMPDCNLGEPFTKPFWQSSFDFLYDHWDKGPCVIGAPYGGPPPHENMYVFTWENFENNDPDDRFNIRQYSRQEASIKTGIEATAALPTGLILWDMRCFELTEPKNRKQEFEQRIAEQWRNRLEKERWRMGPSQIQELVATIVNAKERSERSWFYYEWKDEYEAEKCSTEDVTATRDVSLVGMWKLGYNPVFVNWDAWAGHIKEKVVKKPQFMRADTVGNKIQRAAREGIDASMRLQTIDFSNGESFPAVPCEDAGNCETEPPGFPIDRYKPQAVAAGGGNGEGF
jgi:hypothetical protein